MSNEPSRRPPPRARARAMPQAMAQRRQRRFVIRIAVAVLAGHAAALWLAATAVGPRPPSPRGTEGSSARSAPMIWASVPAPPPSPPRTPALAAAPANRPAPASTAPRSAARTSPAAPRSAAIRPATPPAAPKAAARPVTAPDAQAAAPVRSAPADAGASGDTVSEAPATPPSPPPLRRTLRPEALRDLAGGSRSVQDDPRLASTKPPSAATRLESGMAAAGRGDCLRGEFKGNDMGLLNLPMMALAAAQGRCRLP